MHRNIAYFNQEKKIIADLLDKYKYRINHFGFIIHIAK